VKEKSKRIRGSEVEREGVDIAQFDINPALSVARFDSQQEPNDRLKNDVFSCHLKT